MEPWPKGWLARATWTEYALLGVFPAALAGFVV